MSRGKQKKKNRNRNQNNNRNRTQPPVKPQVVKPQTASTQTKQTATTLSKRKSLSWTAFEIIFAIVLFGIQQGWAMTGFSPNIIVACMIWAVCLLLLIHAFWKVEFTEHWSVWVKSLLSVVALVVVVFVLWNPVRKQFLKEYYPEPLRQYLVPSSELPELGNNVYTVLLGSQCFLLNEYTRGTFVRAGKEDELSAKVKNNQLYIDANIYTSEGKKAVGIKSNDTVVFSDLAYTTKNPDASTLEIRDSKGDLVLHIRYVNSQLIKIQGDFYTVNKGRVKIDEEKTTYGKNGQLKGAQFVNLCVETDETRAAIYIPD